MEILFKKMDFLIKYLQLTRKIREGLNTLWFNFN